MLLTYNPKDIVFSFGTVLVSGFSEGSMVNFEPDEDSFTKVVGADGQVTRSLNANASGRFTCTLKGSSPSNGLLSALHNVDRKNGGGVKPILLKDNNGQTLIASGKAWIVRQPAVDMAKEVTDREWMFDCDIAVVNVGGNNQD